MNLNNIRTIIKTQWLSGSRDNFLLISSPGIGKSAVARQIGEDPELRFDGVLELNLSLLEQPDVVGLFYPGEGSVLKLHASQYLAVMSRSNVLCILEELGDASLHMQNIGSRLIHDREINGVKIADGVRFIGCTNRKTDKSGAGAFSTKFTNRACVMEVDVDLDTWVSDYALPMGVNPVGIQFLRYRPQLFCAFDANAVHGINPTPRSWTNAFRISDSLPDSLYFETVKGYVGEGAAAEFTAFRKIYMKTVSIEDIVVNPTGVKVPEDLSALYATVGSAAHHTTVDNVDKVAKFITRLPKDFETMYWNDCLARNRKIKISRAFIEWATNNNVLM